MAEILCSGQVDRLHLPRLLAACHMTYRAEETLLLVEQLPARVIDPHEKLDMLRFERYRPDLDLAAYTSGRLFQANFELRWERRGTFFQVVYLGSDDNKAPLYDFKLKEDPIFCQLIAGQMLEYREKRYYLFGQATHEHKAEEETIRGRSFAEARIPRILYYPVQAPSRYVHLVVREYVQKETGLVECFRFQSLKPSLEL